MPKPPNIIFIITDDQGYGDIGCHGNPWLETPHLDQMARQGVQLDNHHHDPLCSPSRAALLTGQYAARNGVWHVIQGRHLLHPRATTMADHFAGAGYRCGMFGKWHLGDNFPFAPQYRGFDEVLSHRGGGVGELPDYWGNNYIDDTYFRNGKPEFCQGYCTDVFFDAARDFIAASAGSPFLVYLATNAMHAPFIVPERFAASYKAMGLPEERAKFYGMIANFDENMGKLFADLRRLELEDDTIVVFTSDHGTAAGYDPGTGDGFNAGMRGKKGSVYDGGHRVSCFLRWLGKLPGGKKISQLTAHIDILPSLLELCEIAPAAELEFDGRSLAGLLRGDEMDLPEREIIIQLQPDEPRKWHHTALLKGRWRLINDCELYDIEKDPAQRDNVLDSHSQIAEELRRDYENFWVGMQAAFGERIAIPVGTGFENPVALSARDWHPIAGRVPWRQSWIDQPGYDANGYWLIDVRRTGMYEIELRSAPPEADLPMRADQVVLTIGDIELTQRVGPGAMDASFKLDLRAGETRLSTSLISDSVGRERGAYYVYLRLL